MSNWGLIFSVYNLYNNAWTDKTIQSFEIHEKK